MTITIPIEFIYNSKKGGRMHLYFADTNVDVVDDKTKKIGNIRACIGGGVDFCYKDNVYHMNAKDMWNAFITTLANKSCENNGKN